MKKNVFLFVLILFVQFGCREKTSNNYNTCENVINITPRAGTRVANLSSIYSILNYIPLETKDQCIIGNITKLIVRDHCFWILDELTKSVFCFDSEGKFKFKINNIGKGPGEYLNINDFVYDQNRIYILDVSQGKMNVYENGEFIYEIPKKIYATNFEKLDEEFIFYSAFMQNKNFRNNDKNIIITDSRLREKNTFLPFSEKIKPNSIIRYPKNIQKKGNDIFIWQPFDYNIYQYRKDLLSCKYKIHFEGQNENLGQKILEQVITRNMNGGETQLLMEQSHYCDIIDVMDLPVFFHIIYKYDNSYHFVFFDKKNDKVLDLSKNINGEKAPVPLINDVDGVLYYPLMAVKDDTIYSYANAYEYLENKPIPNALNKQQIDFNSNPVIVTFKIKNLHEE